MLQKAQKKISAWRKQGHYSPPVGHNTTQQSRRERKALLSKCPKTFPASVHKWKLFVTENIPSSLAPLPASGPELTRTGLPSFCNIPTTCMPCEHARGSQIQLFYSNHLLYKTKISAGHPSSSLQLCSCTPMEIKEKDNGPKQMTAIHYHKLNENGFFITASASYTWGNQENVCQMSPTQ